MPDIDKLIRAIDRAEEFSYGSDTDSELSADRAFSIDLYLGKNVRPAPTGRSQVSDRSVFETIQWIKPSLARVFAGGSDLVSIPPIGPDDEDGAKQEAEYINWVITQQNPWFEVFNTWSDDALMTRNAYCMAYVDKVRQVEVEQYERQTQEGVALLMEDGDAEIVELNEYQGEPEPVVGPDGNPMMDEMGQPVMQATPMYDLTLRRTKVKDKICLRVLPPERCKVSHYASSYRLSDCDYFEYWENKTISQLRSEGFDIPDDIPDERVVDTEEDLARDVYNESREQEGLEREMRRVRARMIWIRHDYDEDGIAELQYVVRIGKEILHRQEVNTIPVASMVPSPLPHRHIGISITDMVADIQEIKTNIIRQGLDNLYIANNPQKVVNSHLVNLDDLMHSIPGGIVRTTDVSAVRYEQIPPVFQFALQGLEYMDQVRENRTGTNRYFTGIDQNALNKTATGIQTLSTMAAQRVEQIARIMGSSIEDLARIVHELILKSGHKKDVVKIRGRWVQVDPSSWRKRTDFKIAVGYAAGNKDAMVARLQMILANQFQAIQMGLPIVQPQNIYETQLELAKASDFSSPERFWSDPAEQPPQQGGPDPEMMKLQYEGAAKQSELQLQQESKAAELQLQQDTKTAELQLRDKEIETKAALERYRIDKDAETKVQLALLQRDATMDIESHKSTLAVGGQIEKESARADATAKATIPIIEKQTKQIAEMLGEVLEVVNRNLEVLRGPRRIKRGKDGRPEAVELIGPDGKVVESKSVVRGPDGRIVGTQ